MKKVKATNRQKKPWQVAVLIPTYNEVTNIEKLLQRIAMVCRKLPTSVRVTAFVLDDNSADGTAQVAKHNAKKLRTDKFKIEVVNRPEKAGLGRAYIDGIRMAIAEGFDVIQQMDADLSHDPSYLPEFIKQGQKYDMVVGSRYVPGGDTPDWPFSRRFMSKSGNLYNRIFLGSKVHDYTGGFNQFNSAILKRIDLDNLHNGYCFFLEMKWSVNQLTSKVYEIPIIFLDRQYGSSKIPRKTIIENIVLTQKLWWRSLKNKSKAS